MSSSVEIPQGSRSVRRQSAGDDGNDDRPLTAPFRAPSVKDIASFQATPAGTILAATEKEKGAEISPTSQDLSGRKQEALLSQESDHAKDRDLIEKESSAVPSRHDNISSKEATRYRSETVSPGAIAVAGITSSVDVSNGSSDCTADSTADWSSDAIAADDMTTVGAFTVASGVTSSSNFIRKIKTDGRPHLEMMESSHVTSQPEVASGAMNENPTQNNITSVSQLVGESPVSPLPPTSSTDRVPVVLPKTNSSYDPTKIGTEVHYSSGGPIEARLVSTEDDIAERVQQQVEERLNKQLAERLRSERSRQVPVYAVAIDKEATSDKKSREDPESLATTDDGNVGNESFVGSSKCSWKILLLIFGLLFSAGIAAVMLLVVKDEDAPIPARTAVPTASPITPAPTLSPTRYTTPEFDELLTVIGNAVADNVVALTNPGTVQYQAFNWLANEDKYSASNLPTQVMVERYALVVFYFSTKGSDWNIQYPFMNVSNVCTWNDLAGNGGVICDDNDLYVQSLKLSEVVVQGTIPSELALLSNLEAVELNDNLLFGTLPSQLFQMTSLSVLSLEDCALSGTVPTELGMLINLQWLNLNQNSFIGSMPLELSFLTELYLLQLNQNDLHGTIPSQYGALTEMLNLNLEGNRLTGSIPTEIGNWGSMLYMYLEKNRLRGTLPSELGQLDKLKRFFVYSNLLTGTIPTEYDSMQNLESLSLHYNDLVGNIDDIFCMDDRVLPIAVLWADCLGIDPKVVCSCCTDCCDETDCQKFDPALETEPPTFDYTSEFNSLVDRIGTIVSEDETVFQNPETPQYQAMNWLANVDVWKYDSVVSNQVLVERYALAAWYYSTNGQGWAIQHDFLGNSSVCKWQDETAVVQNISGITCDPLGESITGIDLASTGLQGSIPTEIGLLTNLDALFLKGNELFGTIPSEIYQLSALELLSLSDCFLVGSLSTEIGNLSNLLGLGMFENDLSGPIPTELGRLTQLSQLLMRLNQFEETLPTEIGLLTRLKDLDLEGNELGGSMPSELGLLTFLETLYLENNTFTGTLPTELGALDLVQVFYVHENQLTGALPTEIGQLASVQQLIAYDNQLTGPIPSEIGSLPLLKYLHLFQNEMFDEIPTQTGNLLALTQLLAGENRFNGTIPSQLGHLTLLKQLQLQLNALSGPLPSELGHLAALSQLALYGNILMGSVPNSYGAMGQLETVYLEDNILTGNIDAIFCSTSQSSPIGDLWADCLSNPPEVVCSCCSYCCADGIGCQPVVKEEESTTARTMGGSLSSVVIGPVTSIP